MRAGDKLKLATLTQLGLSLVVSVWISDFASIVAVIGILAVVLSQVELLRLVSTICSSSTLSTRQGVDQACCPSLAMKTWSRSVESRCHNSTVESGYVQGIFGLTP